MVSIEVETDDWLAEKIQCELQGTKLFDVNWMNNEKIMTQRGDGKRQDNIDQGIRSVSLE